MIPTTSLCPVCYKVIPANIVVKSNVIMYKYCRAHGYFSAVIENDPLWYMFCKQNNSKNIYDGYMIDITEQCNLHCKYCYNSSSTVERSLEDILDDVRENRDLAPFILSGGEPTMHSKLPELIKQISEIGEVFVITNGIKLCNEEYFNELLSSGIAVDNVLHIALSLHKEAKGLDIRFLKFCRQRGFIITTLMCVVDDLTQIDYYLSIYKEFIDVIGSIRLKAATAVWNTTNITNNIFVSDMIKYLETLGKTDVLTNGYNNKTSFASVNHEGLLLFLVSWYNKFNIDLKDIDCAPYYKAKDGNIYNILTSFVVNEGIEAQNTLRDRSMYD